MRLPLIASAAISRLDCSFKPVAWAVVCLCATAWPVWAQTASPDAPAEPSPKLKASPQLEEKISPEQKKGSATFVRGDRITGRPEIDTVIDGQAELRRGGIILKADRIEYYQPDDLAKARGNVYLNREGNVYEGSEGQIRVDAQEGYFLNPTFTLLKNGGKGQASRIDFVDDRRSVARNASYTTCRREPEGGAKPDWVIRASQVRFDADTDVGEASDGRLEFKGVPILGAPYFTFPMSDARKSGWLPPSINLDNLSGLEVVVPYYANLAPNRDATIYPGIMSRRGANAGIETRYLEKDYRGIARLDWMPNDSLRSRSRWGVATSHSGLIDSGLPALGAVHLSLGFNRVSDDNYWRDFPRASGSLTQRLLANDAQLSWANSSWALQLRTQKWQTLQQTGSTITPPYDRLPQINARFNRLNVSGFDYSLELDSTRFEADRTLTAQPNAQRSYALAQVSRPFVTPGSFLIPKLQLHSSAYSFDAPLSAGPLSGARSASRVLPSFSLDSGLIFERNASYFGRGFTQTLEPRAFYTYTPYRDQSSLPIYDSGSKDYNFATVFSENTFTGQDRLADNNLLTLGLNSRLLDPASGAEVARFNYAQRLRFRNQQVILPGGTPDNSRFSDMLFGAGVNLDTRWQVDSNVQYSPSIRRSLRTTLGARYSPSDYRTVSATYRLKRGESEQIDLGWQWPINDLWGDVGKSLGRGLGLGDGRWYSVGRMNYSLRESKVVDTLVGFEYDAGCWLMRFALERLQTTTSSANKRIMFQMEFVGFARVGSNPLSALQGNIPRYQLLREKITTPSSRFSNYE
jgi:LPS-assembly protein